MSSWKDITDDPNSSAALAFRQQNISAALRPAVTDRIHYLKSLASGKRVLDVGVVDHLTAVEHRSGRTWLHGEIARVAAYCLGIDVLVDATQDLARRGYNVLVGDITTVELDETFDLIVAGEVIEHLGNPEGLFSAASRYLAPAGALVITTPNPYYANRVWTNWRGTPRDNVDHIALFWPSGIAELAERSGLRLWSYRPVCLSEKPRTVKGRAFMWMAPLWKRMGLSASAHAETIIYEVRRL